MAELKKRRHPVGKNTEIDSKMIRKHLKWRKYAKSNQLSPF